MVKTKHNTTQDMVDKLQELKGKKINIKIYVKYYAKRNYRRRSGYFQFSEDTFSKNTESIS